MAAKSQKQTPSHEMENVQRDYVAIAVEYAQAAVADKKGKRFGKWVRLAAKRFLNDLKKAKRKDSSFIFDEWHANDACDFIEKLPHVEGEWETPNIVMHASHVFFVVNLFGFRNRDGTRRFTTALFAVARKNAKSLLCSAVLLYCFCCENENGPQVVSAATTGSQARIVFNAAKRIVEKTPDLREAFTLEPFANAIARYEVGGTFKPINAKASTQDGLNPSHVGIDEIHAHKSHDLLNVLKSAAGARKNPLFLYTTTEGYESPGPWPEIRHFAKQLLEGAVVADHFLAVYYALDDKDDDFDESKWIKANPLMEVNPLLIKEIRKESLEAKAMPGRHAEFKIKRLNRPSSSATAWVDLRKWNRCDGPVDLEWLKGHPCVMALDLASTTDLASVRLTWNIEGKYYTYGRCFVPESAVKSRTERGSAPYAAWIAAGLLTVTPGEVTDYAIIEAFIVEMFERFQPSEVCYDPWNASDLVSRLVDKGLPMVEFIQGAKSYNPAMQALEMAYIAGLLSHGGDPVLRWCISNLIARYDANMNMAPDKKRSADKIDDACTLLMTIGRLVHAEPEEKSFWES
ncbi:MAG: terminase TerL endonuclease subunit [Pseudomonadota bacterium]